MPLGGLFPRGLALDISGFSESLSFCLFVCHDYVILASLVFILLFSSGSYLLLFSGFLCSF